MNRWKGIVPVALLAATVVCGCGAKENDDARGSLNNGAGQASSAGNAGVAGNAGSGNAGAADHTGAAGQNGNTPEGEDRFDKNLVSDEYLVGVDYFTGDFLEFAPTVIAKVRYDGRLEVGFDHTLSNGDTCTETVFFDLSDQQYHNIEAAIQLKKLYELDPEEADPAEVCDGGCSYLIIYGKDGDPYKVCGGFCPHNRDFNDMQRAVYENLPDNFREYCDRYKTAWVREENFEPYHGDPGNTYISTSYGVFLNYDGDLQDLGDYDYLVIDAQYHDASEIAGIHKYDQYIYSYINIGSLEDFREYYDEYADLALGEYENWDGEEWVDVSDARWQDFILNELAPELLAKGVDGFFVDNCDVYYQYPTQETLDGLSKIMRGLKAMGCDVIINGGDAFLDAYTAQNGDWRDVITGINQECVFTAIDWEADALTAASEEDHEYFTDYIERYGDQGAYIFLLEYAEDTDANRTLQYDIRYYAEEHGYLYYISDSIDLDH
ncbi:MAG: endo alpha-1,4 polygalactosaminidase [Lachnospiraceae bacterium]|nr:endo alpha-1,4 polygalactosaminidase [Lachnospiraceae bacterium]MBO6298958.1 endo alpha-1,4 polygalactosaminidase [Lachnospiraceae bacterium]MBP3296301.1 endo alpha-1,4 polygalactosaminidase [Lachnospiraceae bacterium]